MGQRGEGIHRFSVEQDIELRQLGRTETADMIVERGIALRDALQLVVEIDHNLSQGEHEVKLDAITTDILLIDKFSALIQTEGHDRSDIVSCRDD